MHVFGWALESGSCEVLDGTRQAGGDERGTGLSFTCGSSCTPALAFAKLHHHLLPGTMMSPGWCFDSRFI